MVLGGSDDWDDVGNVGRLCGDDVEIVWGLCGDNVGIVWGL